jgi:hypothetical protein
MNHPFHPHSGIGASEALPLLEHYAICSSLDDQQLKAHEMSHLLLQHSGRSRARPVRGGRISLDHQVRPGDIATHPHN